MVPSNIPSMNLIELLKSPEGRNIEFKRELPTRFGIVHTVVAFANTSGGTIIIGVEDGTRKIVGVSDPLTLEEKITSLITDLIVPQILPEIEIISYKKLQIIAIRIYPSPLKPHYLKSKGLENGTYVRIGSTNRVADFRFIQELKRSALNQSYDEQPFMGLGVDDIDFEVVSSLYESIKKVRRNDLATLRLTMEYQGKIVPTIGGVILFGKKREQFFPDAWIKVGRFLGTTKEKIADSLDIHSYPVLAVEEVIRFIQKHATMGIEITDVKHIERWSVPIEAIREAVINSVVHADYSQLGSLIRVSIFQDRIEIENPGLLPFGITIDDITLGVSKLRNRVIGRIFNDLKLIEQWGSGIQRIIAVCKELQLRAPLFEEIGTNFRVTIFTIQSRNPIINSVDQKILDLLRDKNGVSTAEVANLIDLSVRSTRSRLSSLIKRGLIVEIGSGKNDPTKKFFLKR